MHYLLSRTRKIIQTSSFLATCGTMIMLLGGIWDSSIIMNSKFQKHSGQFNT
ncbi:hypothetical protein DYY67_2161 [Candidatus Nitrosotalea sp. TS]|nr:hypothetical protein [Candidatus Nitrosotalea sp. TS]